MTAIRECLLSLGCVWLADLINEKGWYVTNYFGTDDVIKADYDRRLVLQAEPHNDRLKLTLGLINQHDTARRIRRLDIPFQSKHYAAPRFFVHKVNGKEIIAINWEEIWPGNIPWPSLIELRRP